MDLALDLLYWRSYLANCSVSPSADAVLRIAQRHADAAGEKAVGLARVVAELVQGFSPQLEYMRAAAERNAPALPTRSSQLPDSMSMARMELRSFASQFAAGQRNFGDHLRILSTPEISESETSSERVAADIYALHALLGSTDDADIDEGAALLSRLGHWCSGLDKLEPRILASAGLTDLICGLTALNLRTYLRGTIDLAGGPIGSVAMLRAAARFDSFGLGPYFRNVGALARHSRDVFELGYIVVDAAAEAGTSISIETCVALLARSCTGPLLFEIADDLGDLDARAALAMLLARAVNDENMIGLGMVERLRDIALDNLDYRTAAQAQRHICDMQAIVDIQLALPGSIHATLRNKPMTTQLLDTQANAGVQPTIPGSTDASLDNKVMPGQVLSAQAGTGLQLAILGSIHASLGNKLVAVQLLEEALQYDPTDRRIRERLTALTENRFGPFVITAGFNSPEGRRHARQTRRAAVSPPAQQATGPAATGVEFTH